MGELILCKTSLAANPYFIEEATLNIYSLEELSFYIYNNSYLMREDFFDEGFCNWIRDELKATGLYNEIMRFKENEAGLAVLVGHVLRYSGYLSKTEIKTVKDTIASFEGKSEAEARKLRADHLVDNGRYLDAVFSYESIFDKKHPMSDSLKGDIYHNLACALCGLFFFERATEYFELAYRMNRQQISLDMLLYACLFSENEDNFKMYIDRYQVLPEDEKRIRIDFEEAIRSRENSVFAEKLHSRLGASRDEVEREYVYRDVIEDFKAGYRSLRTF